MFSVPWLGVLVSRALSVLLFLARFVWPALSLPFPLSFVVLPVVVVSSFFLPFLPVFSSSLLLLLLGIGFFVVSSILVLLSSFALSLLG